MLCSRQGRGEPLKLPLPHLLLHDITELLSSRLNLGRAGEFRCRLFFVNVVFVPVSLWGPLFVGLRIIDCVERCINTLKDLFVPSGAVLMPFFSVLNSVGCVRLVYLSE